MILYPLKFEADDNGTFLVTCPVLPEVTTFGEDWTDAIHRGAEAVEEAIAARISDWQEVPVPDGSDLAPALKKNQATAISLLAEMKLHLYMACREANVTRAELVRRTGWHREQVDRLFRFDHASKVEQMEAALRALNQRFDVRPQAIRG